MISLLSAEGKRNPRRRNLSKWTVMPVWLPLTMPRSNEIVVRGSSAMAIVYQLSSRVPKFIESSHLGGPEGRLERPFRFQHSTNNRQHGRRTGLQSSKH